MFRRVEESQCRPRFFGRTHQYVTGLRKLAQAYNKVCDCQVTTATHSSAMKVVFAHAAELVLEFSLHSESLNEAHIIIGN